MVMSPAHYLQQLQALLPLGRAWPRDPDAVLTRRLQALADELARVDARAAAALDEVIPDHAAERLPEWEVLTGVSGREAVLAQLSAQGGSTETYFIELTDVLGLAITIDDDLTGYQPNFTCVSPCNAALQGFNKRFWWQVTVAAAGPQPALEALFIKLKPAHTRVTFFYA